MYNDFRILKLDEALQKGLDKDNVECNLDGAKLEHKISTDIGNSGSPLMRLGNGNTLRAIAVHQGSDHDKSINRSLLFTEEMVKRLVSWMTKDEMTKISLIKAEQALPTEKWLEEIQKDLKISQLENRIN